MPKRDLKQNRYLRIVHALGDETFYKVYCHAWEIPDTGKDRGAWAAQNGLHVATRNTCGTWWVDWKEDGNQLVQVRNHMKREKTYTRELLKLDPTGGLPDDSVLSHFDHKKNKMRNMGARR